MGGKLLNWGPLERSRSTRARGEKSSEIKGGYPTKKANKTSNGEGEVRGTGFTGPTRGPKPRKEDRESRKSAEGA